MLSSAVQTHKHTNIKREKGHKVNMQKEGDQKGQEGAQENHWEAQSMLSFNAYRN